jgi:hypothetical protein
MCANPPHLNINSTHTISQMKRRASFFSTCGSPCRTWHTDLCRVYKSLGTSKTQVLLCLTFDSFCAVLVKISYQYSTMLCIPCN